MRRDHANTPPNPDNEMVAKAMNSSKRDGCVGGGAGEDAEAEMPVSDMGMVDAKIFDDETSL
jgi:hypothetical protein